jgi:hypothetical protein
MSEPSAEMRASAFDTEAFYVALDAHRRLLARNRGRRVTWREIGRELAISQSTFTRLGIYNQSLTTSTLVKLLSWLGETDLKPYIAEESP